MGPIAGFSAVFLGSSVARMIKPSADWMFGVIAEPVGVFLDTGKCEKVEGLSTE